MTDPEKLEPGIYDDIPWERYFAIDALDNTLLMEYAKSAATGREMELNPRPMSSAFVIGQALHAAILEPERFKQEYVVPPKINRRTNAGKAAWAEWQEKFSDKVAITREEYDLAMGMKAAVWSRETPAHLLGGEGRNETTILWDDADTGVRCKARLDRLTYWHGWPAVVDVKTCREGQAHVDRWPWVMKEFAYHQQAAWYLSGLNTLAPADRIFVFLAVEKTRPYLTACHAVNEPSIREGRALYRKALQCYLKARETNQYPGYDEGIEYTDIPESAFVETTPEH